MTLPEIYSLESDLIMTPEVEADAWGIFTCLFSGVLLIGGRDRRKKTCFSDSLIAPDKLSMKGQK